MYKQYIIDKYIWLAANRTGTTVLLIPDATCTKLFLFIFLLRNVFAKSVIIDQFEERVHKRTFRKYLGENELFSVKIWLWQKIFFVLFFILYTVVLYCKKFL